GSGGAGSGLLLDESQLAAQAILLVGNDVAGQLGGQQAHQTLLGQVALGGRALAGLGGGNADSVALGVPAPGLVLVGALAFVFLGGDQHVEGAVAGGQHVHDAVVGSLVVEVIPQGHSLGALVGVLVQDLQLGQLVVGGNEGGVHAAQQAVDVGVGIVRSEEHTSELQSRFDLVCRLLLEKKK